MTVCAAVAFVASSLYSTSTFLTSWRDNPTQPYLQNARAALAQAHASSDAPMLDQEVDPLVLQRVAWPENLVSATCSRCCPTAPSSLLPQLIYACSTGRATSSTPR